MCRGNPTLTFNFPCSTALLSSILLALPLCLSVAPCGFITARLVACLRYRFGFETSATMVRDPQPSKKAADYSCLSRALSDGRTRCFLYGNCHTTMRGKGHPAECLCTCCSPGGWPVPGTHRTEPRFWRGPVQDTAAGLQCHPDTFLLPGQYTCTDSYGFTFLTGEDRSTAIQKSLKAGVA